jgi:membrane protease subunit HflK
MAWNEPGGPKNNDPWGNKNNNDQGPPDLDEVIKNLNEKVSKLFGRTGGGGADDGGKRRGFSQPPTLIIGIVIVLLVVIWTMAGIYTVDQGKQAVITQFGSYHATEGAGIQWYAPVIQQYQIVDVSASRSLNLGGNTHEAMMLTKDENIVDIKVAVQFKVSHADQFLFNVKEPGLVLRQVSESAVREIVGKNNMDFILTEGRSAIAGDIGALAQKILDRYKTGLLITKFTLQSAKAPPQVQDAFEDVNAAREDKERFVNEAQAYNNDVLPKARGIAARQVAEAQAYEAKVVAEAEGDVSRFLSILREYEKAPQVTRDRLYIDALENVYANSTKIMVDTSSSNNLMYLPLDKLMQKHTVSPDARVIYSREGLSEQEYNTLTGRQPDKLRRSDQSRSRPSIRETR